MKIIQIDGIKGIITVFFVCSCAFAGFVLSPGYAAMSLWNKYLAQTYMFPTLNLLQGVLLWGIAVICYFIISGNGFALSFKNSPEISDEEISSIIKSAKINAKMRTMNRMISKIDTVELDKSVNKSKPSEDKDTSFVSAPIDFSGKSVDKVEKDTISKIK